MKRVFFCLDGDTFAMELEVEPDEILLHKAVPSVPKRGEAQFRATAAPPRRFLKRASPDGVEYREVEP